MDFDEEFLAKRLRRLATLLGHAVPESDETLANCAGSVLGSLALTVERMFQKMPFPFSIEHARAIAKYPPELWEKLHPQEMHDYMLQEADELKAALWREDLYGEHGIIREAVHVQVVAQRIIDEMRRRHERG